MGVSFKDIIKGREIDIKELENKTLAIDSFNMLYQFLTTIRGVDGSLLTNRKGDVTSHIVGLLSRTLSLLDSGIKPIFIFDGIPPDLKKKERERRRKLKEEAKAKYEVASKEDNIQEMKKFAARTTVLTKEMIEDAKEVINLMGLPVIEAPSEGEAQAAYFVKKGIAYASISQDFDSLLFGCSLLIRNLTVAGRRKRIHGMGTVVVKPEVICLKNVLNELEITKEDLIVLGILIGTDFNIGGVKGIGPKKAIKLIKKYDTHEEIFENVEWTFPFNWKEVYDIFDKIPVEKFEITWKKPKFEELELFLKEKEFSEERIKNVILRLKKSEDRGKQKGLMDFM